MVSPSRARAADETPRLGETRGLVGALTPPTPSHEGIARANVRIGECRRPLQLGHRAAFPSQSSGDRQHRACRSDRGGLGLSGSFHFPDASARSLAADRSSQGVDRCHAVGRRHLQSDEAKHCNWTAANFRSDVPDPPFYRRFVDRRPAESLEDSPAVLVYGPRQCGSTTASATQRAAASSPTGTGRPLRTRTTPPSSSKSPSRISARFRVRRPASNARCASPVRAR